MKGAAYTTIDFVSKYLYTDRVNLTLREIFVKSKARTLTNKILGVYYGDQASITVLNEDVYFGAPSFEEFMILRGLKSDKSALEEIIQDLDQDTTFYDIGANIGLYSCSIGKIAECDVYSFEPHPENAKRLAENAQRNDISLNLIQKAVSDVEGTEKINIEKNVSGEGQANLTTGETGQDVDSCRLDNLIPQDDISKADAMKIDVEGAEIKVIDGMENLSTEELPESIYCEIHPTVTRHGSTPEEVEQKLEDMGYSLEVMERMPGRRRMVKAELQS